MIESIAATSLLGHQPIYGSYSCKNVLYKRKPSNLYRLPFTEFLGKEVSFCTSLPRWCYKNPYTSFVKSQAMELTKETYFFRDKERKSKDFRYGIATPVDWRPPENKADNPSLNNPLLRLERMGCGWVVAIFEWDGVLIEDNPVLEKQAWLALCQEEGRSPPPAFILKRIEGMKNEQAIAEVLCWSRDPNELKRMACRKEEIYQSLNGGIYHLRSGSQEFVNFLKLHNVPVALVSTRPRKYLEMEIGATGIDKEIFKVIVTAEDVYRGKPDPEMFVYAAQLLQFIPERCIVFGNSNQTVEAAHDARMKCVSVASKHPVYELGAADLVVKRLDELSVVDLKSLADIESAEDGSSEPGLEVEVEDDDERCPPSSVGVDDGFW